MSSDFHLRLLARLAAGILFLVPAARAQAVSPVIVEFRETARGQLQVANNTLYPFDVVLEPFSFNADADGKPAYRPLDSGIQVRLSATSFRLGPKRTYTVFYEAAAENLPAWFTIYATITRSGSRADFKVAYQLPHTVYLLPRKDLEPAALHFRSADLLPAAGRLQVVVENQSGEFARVQEVELRGVSGKQTFPGFPFFPHQQRRLVLEFGDKRPPELVVLRFAHFEVEQPVTKTSP